MTHQLNGKGAILVQDRIIKHHIPAWGEDELLPYVVPHPAGRNLCAAEVAVDRVMAEPFAMVRKVRQRVVDLTDQQVLAIIEASHCCFPIDNSIAFSRFRRLSWSLVRKS
jgi:hypothetical protein